MPEEKAAIGIDIGSLYVKIITVDKEGKAGSSSYTAHKGHPIQTLKGELPKF